MTRPTSSRWHPPPVLTGGVLFVLAVVLPLYRERGHASWRTMWAKDGEVYYQQVRHGGLTTAFRGYDGYVQLVSRLVMLPARLVPVTGVPLYAAVASTFVAAVPALLVYRWTEGYIASRTCRLALAAMHVLAPALGWEGTANVAWLIYLVLPVVPWAIIARRRGRVDVVGRAVLVFVAALSHVLVAVFAPLAIAVAWRRRARPDTVVAASMLLGLALQGALMLGAASRHHSSPFALTELVGLVSVLVLGSFLVGDAPLKSLWLDWGWATAVVFVISTSVVFSVALVAASRSSRRRALVWIGYAALIAALPLVANGTHLIHLVEGLAPPLIQRYEVVPVLLLVGAVAMLVDPTDRPRSSSVARVGRGILIAQLVVIMVTSFRVTNLRSTGPLWTDALQRARATCEATSAPSAKVLIAPDGWYVVIECSDLHDL